MAWVCHDYNVAPYKYNVSFDSNLFAAFSAYDHGEGEFISQFGNQTFGLYAPDGTGVGYFACADEMAGQDGSNKGIQFVNSGSAYDGMYTNHGNYFTSHSGWYFIAQDSFKGIITGFK